MWESYKNQIIENKKMEDDWYIVGIDLGTTHSVMSYITRTSEKPELVDMSNGFGKIPMPSVVQCRRHDREEEWVVGEEAYRALQIYPETTIMSIKKKMGTSKKVTLGGCDYLPEEISAMILKALFNHLQEINPKLTLAGVVVSVPYDFDDSAKKATIRACGLAGILESLICLIEEPKAALLAYNFTNELYDGEKIMVFDFGGGTLDITVFQVHKRKEQLFLKVLSEGGEASHGGDIVDEMILDKMIQDVEEGTGLSKESITKEQYAEMFVKAKEVKERLSGVKKYRIPYTFCVPPFIKEMSREDLEMYIRRFIEKTRRLVIRTLEESYDKPLAPRDINRVLLEGGASKMPWVKDMLVSIFDEEDKIYLSEKPALDIAIGATYYAGMKMGALKHTDIKLGKRDIEFEVSIPHDIGFEIVMKDKRVFHKMIARGTPYSLAKKSQVFTLTGDNEEDMTSFNLKIIERINKGDQVKKCPEIGEIHITGLPKRPSGKTKLKITLIVEEENGIIKGTVKDVGYDEDYPSSGFVATFEPKRYIKTVIEG